MPETPLDAYVAAQIRAKDRPSVIKMKLLNMRSEYPSGLIVAVEGDDDKIVYSRWISVVAPQLRYEFMVCGGKRQVRQLRNSLAKDLGGLDVDIKFVVDRDFDDLRGFDTDDNVFMIERYSVENFILEDCVIDLTMSVAFPCNGLPAMRAEIVDIFNEDYSNFLNATKDLNRNIYVARREGIDIDDLIPRSLDKFVAIKLGSVSRVDYEVEEIIPLQGKVSEENLAKLHAEFEELHPPSRFRGKFAYKFLTKWLLELADEFRNSHTGLFGLLSANGGKIEHLELSLGALASRSPYPEGFGVFLAS